MCSAYLQGRRRGWGIVVIFAVTAPDAWSLHIQSACSEEHTCNKQVHFQINVSNQTVLTFQHMAKYLKCWKPRNLGQTVTHS